MAEPDIRVSMFCVLMPANLHSDFIVLETTANVVVPFFILSQNYLFLVVLAQHVYPSFCQGTNK